eukprot:8099465-Pyramimonas_sp.AAC.1
MASVCSDDIIYELVPESPEEGEPQVEPKGKAPSNQIRKATPPAQPSGDAASPAKPAGEVADLFSPSDVVMNDDIEMDAGVEIHAEEIAARKRAADAAIDDNKPAKRTAISSQGEYNTREEKSIFRCFPDKRDWSRPNYAGAIKFMRRRGWSWHFTMWRNNILGRPSRYRTEGRFSRHFPDDR